MQRLANIIGPAPSELSEDGFAEVLARERLRVSHALTEIRMFGERKARKTSRAKKPKVKSLVTKAMEKFAAAGITLEDLEKLVEEADESSN